MLGVLMLRRRGGGIGIEVKVPVRHGLEQPFRFSGLARVNKPSIQRGAGMPVRYSLHQSVVLI